MRGRLLLLAYALVLVAPSVDAQSGSGWTPDGCYIDGERGIVDCSGSTRRDEAPQDKPWYREAGTLAEIGAVTASIGGGVFAAVRIRKKRRTLSGLLAAIETTYVQRKGEPSRGVDELVAIRRDMRDMHGAGRIDDAHFLELDKRVTDAIAKLRRAALEQACPDLPAPLVERIRECIADGTVSQADLTSIKRAAAARKVPDADRQRLSGLVGHWCAQDAGEKVDGGADAPAEIAPA